jgi:hypothetical protein
VATCAAAATAGATAAAIVGAGDVGADAVRCDGHGEAVEAGVDGSENEEKPSNGSDNYAGDDTRRG